MAALTSAAFASTESSDTATTVTASLDYVSAYTFRGVKLANDSVQPAISIARGAFYGGIWANRPFDSSLHSEIDWNAGYTLPSGLDLGLTAYTYPGSAKTTWEPYIGYAHDFAKTKLSLYLYRDLTLRSTAAEAKVSNALFTVSKITVNVDAALGLSNDGDQSYTYWSVGPSAKYSVNESLSVTAGAQYVSSDDKTIQRDIVASRISMAYNF